MILLLLIAAAFSLVGFLIVVASPIAPMLSSRLRWLSRVWMWLALWINKRSAIVVSEHGDLAFKPMEYTNLGYERLTISGEEHAVGDPAVRLHEWMGFPFALSNGKVLFDPRDAAVGARKKQHEKQKTARIESSESDLKEFDIGTWMPGVFELPARKHELVELNAVEQLLNGGERGEYPKRVEELYKLSRRPMSSSVMPVIRLLIPVGAFVIVFLLMWQAAGDATSAADTEVGFDDGWLALLLIPALDRAKQQLAAKWRMLAVGLGAAILFAAIAASIWLVGIYPVLAAAAGILAGILLPILFIAILGTVAPGTIAPRLLKLSMLGWDRPVWVWQPDGYRLREADELSIDTEHWYRLAGKQVGFSYEPDPAHFDAIDHQELKAGQLEKPADSKVPAGKQPVELLNRPPYGGFAPTNLKNSQFYVNVPVFLNDWSGSAEGENTFRRLLQAKEEFGDGQFGISDKTLLLATVGAVLLAASIAYLGFYA